ncbi:MAG: tRNA1(Val) (adenine(37)-N6)-methyltransferase [Lachnospiraceae bacterium]|nr:tRNA1(Val) (adenine(37)-N6)-methyltransferase [Lachnospiraceae bacterium]
MVDESLPEDVSLQGLRCDDLQNGYKIYQDPSMFCFGVDAVLLAHYPKLKKNDKVADLGTGFAPIPLILAAEAEKKGLSAVRIAGLEIQDRAAETARLSVRENHLQQVVEIVSGDIREASKILGAASRSLVLSNPPYMAVKDGLVGEDRAKAIARTELLCTLEDVIREGARLLMPGGRMAMIHRPFRLPDMMLYMRQYGLEPKRMRLVCPYADAEPTMVLLEGLKGGKPYLKVEKPLVIYHRDQTYTEELLTIYGRNTVSGRDTDRQS